MEIQFLPGVGPKRAQLLDKELGIRTIGDLIRLYPFRYIDKSSFVRICDARPDMAYIQIRATVRRIDLYGNGATSMEAAATAQLKYSTVKRMSVWVEDGSGEMEMVFFKGIKWMHEKLKPGMTFIFFGKPTAFNGKINIVHPEVDTADNRTEIKTTGAGATMTGVYTSTEKLKNGGITGKVMNKLMESALNKGLHEIEESLPEYIMKQQGLVPLHFALRNIHFPTDAISLEKARYRLKFEELFYLQLSLLKQKYIRSREDQGIAMPRVGEAFNRCYEALPFPLTGAQKRVITEIRNDLRSGRQMNRLLQGDVGSGKTMVAVLTALIAIGNGYQACIMAPTEVLAQQHFKNIQKFLAPTGVKSALLTGSSKTKERKEIHQGLEDGSIGIIVGTHALLEDVVVFRNLGLAIIDEQHRFGVEQRSRLWKKSSAGVPPHVLVMTATPIPRTLAMTLYVIAQLKPEESYRLKIDSAACKDIYGVCNDSLQQNIKLKSKNDYSSLRVKMLQWDARARIQLMDEKDEVLKELPAHAEGALFEYLKPTTYYLRVYIDENGDGKWTTGDWLQKRQPEPIYYYPKKLKLRANWDFEEQFDHLARPQINSKPKALREKKSNKKRR